MNGKYPFPDDIRDPNRKEPNPFADADDVESTAAAPKTFEATKHSNEYQPVYQAILPDRAVLTLIVGTVGLLASLSGWPSYLGGGAFASLLLMPIFSLSGSLPALLISISDLRAMRKGAMRPERRGWSRWGRFLGAAGVLNSLAFIAVGLLRWWGYL